MAGSSAPPKGCLFADPYTKPLIGGRPLPLCYRLFYVSGTAFATQATVYQDGFLTTPFVQPVTADTNGRFPPIYLDPSVVYATQLFSAANVSQEMADPIPQQPPSLAASVLTSVILTGSAALSATTLSTSVVLGSSAPATTYAFEAYLDLLGVTGTVGIQLVASAGLLNSSYANTFTALGLGNTPSVGQLNSTASFTVNAAGNGLWIRGVLTATASGTLSISWSNGGSGTVFMNAGSYLLLQPIVNLGVIFREPQNKPLAAASSLAQTQPGVYRQFFFTGTSVLAPVYADAGLTNPLSQVPGQQLPSSTADGNGRLSVIYLDPSIVYKTQLFAANGTALQPAVDPYVPRAFEPITAVKTAPTVRLTGVSTAPDSALQITLNPGTYAIDSMLEFVPSASSLTTSVQLAAVAGTGAVAGPTLGVGSSVAYEGNGNAAVFGSYLIGVSQSFALAGALSKNTLYSRGTVTVTGAPITFGLLWSVSGGSAGANIGLNAGSFLQAVQVG